jgi:hypothetical protein
MKALKKHEHPLSWTVPALLLLAAAPVASGQDDDDEDDDDRCPTACERSADALREASRHEARDDFWIGLVDCLNLADPVEARECFLENRRALSESLDLVVDQHAARLELCAALGEERYDPDIDPRDFRAPRANPYFPLTPGTTRIYEKETAEGLERVETTVTGDRRTILGVACVVVRDVASLEGEVVEDTLDYFAADRHGNVWYFGELAMNFEDGLLHDLDGSWIAGEGGARPGIIMQAVRFPGDVYRQEFFANDAEDAARITAIDRTVRVPFGTFTNCLETLDFTPLEPDHLERKFYAPGVGPVLEVNVATGERLELIGVR